MDKQEPHLDDKVMPLEEVIKYYEWMVNADEDIILRPDTYANALYYLRRLQSAEQENERLKTEISQWELQDKKINDILDEAKPLVIAKNQKIATLREQLAAAKPILDAWEKAGRELPGKRQEDNCGTVSQECYTDGYNDYHDKAQPIVAKLIAERDEALEREQWFDNLVEEKIKGKHQSLREFVEKLIAENAKLKGEVEQLSKHLNGEGK